MKRASWLEAVASVSGEEIAVAQVAGEDLRDDQDVLGAPVDGFDAGRDERGDGMLVGVEELFDDCKQNFQQSIGDYPAEMLAAEPPGTRLPSDRVES